MKARIVKRTYPDGAVKYVIQQRHWLFRWQWVDAWVNSTIGAPCEDTFNTLEQAKENLVWFDGSKSIDAVIGSE